MSTVYPTLPKLAVRDGFDEEDLTDIDDEVFIRDGKNGGLKLDEDGGVKRPLMASRRRCKKSYSFETFSTRTCYIPLCLGFIALIILLSIIPLCVYIINIIPVPMPILKNWLSHDYKEILNESKNESNIVPCTSLTTTILWTKSLPKLTPESSLRSTDINKDGVEDIIVGFSTGLDMIDVPEYICMVHFNGQVPCFGGVLALDGRTGNTLWTHWMAHSIYSVDCSLDLTNDTIKDCIICGHGGILHAIRGHDGSTIWEAPVEERSISDDWRLADIYDARFIADIDGDEIGDVIASHTIQSKTLSEILIISGVNGNIVHVSVLPSTEQLLLAPQKLVHPDGENIFVFTTTSRQQTGGLYVVPQVNLMYGDLKLRRLHRNAGKGSPLPPILVDITLDGVEDIVTALSNSTIIVYNGLTFKPIWDYTIPNSKVISIPIPGYYNDDNVPDFMVKYQIGSDSFTYNYTVTTIIDGKTGMPLLEKPIEGLLSKEMSGLSVTVEDFGNDWFLYWSVECLNYEVDKEKYQSLKNAKLAFESYVDVCKLRFNSTLTTNLYALSQHVGPPGISLYFSEYLNPRTDSYANNAAFVSERSSKKYESRNEKIETNIMNTELENPGNLNNDYIWKNENRWTQKNVQDKDYDGSYDGENNINVGEEESVDYSEAGQVREQRSSIDSKSINSFDRNINDFVRNTISNETGVINGRNRSEQLNDYATNHDMKTLLLSKRTVNFEVANKNGTNASMEWSSTEEEASIEKVFKRESLRKQNKRKISKGIPLRSQRIKREADIRSNGMYRMYGIEKQPPTGILLPSLSVSKNTIPVDLVFSTFSLPSSDTSKMLIQEDLDCINRKRVLSTQRLHYKHQDDFVKECLAERGINYKMYQEATDRENFKISFGKMIIYRMKLECTCPEDMLPNESCKNISSHQSWSEYLGSQGNGYFKTLHKTKL
ncbi:uncharacterized protein LOC143208973 isoform X1 [Lasioglossum baleicum]|uniref:uncharacterized protein LOC143208973 isoform X1 n=2 Tax=Lasioglossum baleicum TaxID=434251 RepID=UPI003FCC9669